MLYGKTTNSLDAFKPLLISGFFKFDMKGFKKQKQIWIREFQRVKNSCVILFDTSKGIMRAVTCLWVTVENVIIKIIDVD